MTATDLHPDFLAVLLDLDPFGFEALAPDDEWTIPTRDLLRVFRAGAASDVAARAAIPADIAVDEQRVADAGGVTGSRGAPRFHALALEAAEYLEGEAAVLESSHTDHSGAWGEEHAAHDEYKHCMRLSGELRALAEFFAAQAEPTTSRAPVAA